MKKTILTIIAFCLVMTPYSLASLTAYYDPVSNVQTGWTCTGVDCGVGQYEVLNDGARQGVSTPSTATDFITKLANSAAISEHQVSAIQETSINYITLWAYVQSGSNFELILAIENNGVEQVSQTYATGLTPQWVFVNWTDANLATIGTLTGVMNGQRNGGGGSTSGFVYSWYLEVNYNDAQPPNGASPLTFPVSPVTYSPSQNYQFNVTWTDNIGVSNVLMEHNFLGSFSNYSISGNTGSVYYYNYGPLAAGTYSWRMHANDTFNNWNYTPIYSYTVNRAQSSTTLTLDDLVSNASIESGEFVNITATKNSGEGIIRLYNNGTLINSGNGPLNNYTRFVIPGIYNISVNYDLTQNYSSNQSTLFVDVTDTIPPNAIFNSLTPNPAQYGSQNVLVNWQVQELNPQVSYLNITYPNGTLLGQFATNITLNHTTNLNILGTYNATIYARDTSGNEDITSQTFIVRDTIAPTFSNIEETPVEPVTYSPLQGYQFNITWSDLHGVANVWLVFNGITYFDPTNNSQEFSKTFSTLFAGQHNYTWYANDSSGNLRATTLQTYTINKDSSQVNLTLNNQNNNLTINEGQLASVNASLINPSGGIVNLYRNGLLIQTGSNSLVNNSILSAGIYNFTAAYLNSQNYTASYLSYYLTVNSLPISTLLTPPDFHTDVDGTFSLTCQGSDVEGLQSITVYHNFSQPFGANETIFVNGTSSTVMFNFTGVVDGVYVWNCLVNDTYNATDFDDNRSIIINSSANQPPIPHHEFPTPAYITNNQSIDFNCSATDPEGLNNISLWWNVGGSFQRNETINVSGIENSTIFSKANIPEGSYLWACAAGDAFGQSAITTNRSFLVDITPPSIALSLLENNTNLTTSSGFFNFTVYDNYDTSISCNLTIDDTAVRSTNIANGSLYSTTVNSIIDGTHYYNVSCVDNANNVNTSQTRIFYVFTIGIPQNIQIILANDNLSTILNWTNLAKADYYNIYITNNYAQGFGSTPNITNVLTSNYTDSSANSSNTRYYRVSAVNGAAENISNITVGKIGRNNLDSGFHLVSFPFINDYELNNGTNNGFTLSTQPYDCVQGIFRWNGSLFEETVNEGLQNYLPAIGSESFTELEPLRSYWLLTNSSCFITYLGTVPTESSTISINNSFFLAGWHSPHEVLLGQESIVGNPLVVSPVNSLTNIYRFNSTTDLFEGTTHFAGYGWWPSFNSQHFTTLNPTFGYYFAVNPVSNWTHDPEFIS